MPSPIGFLSTVLACAVLANCLTPAEWRRQSIYQVMTDRFARSDGSTTASCDLDEYCGGTWIGLINQLDYIQQMGFTAVWISPIVKNKVQSSEDGNSYHGYWAQDLYSVNSQFGTEEDLKALSDELHKRGMYLMVDVVPNHMASFSSQTTVDYSQFNPFNKKSYFHTPCEIDYDDINSVEYCWMGSNTVSLPDLRTEDSVVANMWYQWISQIVSRYSIDGLRIDTAYEVSPRFWAGFQAAAGGIHVLGEVWHGNPNVLCPYQNYLTGLMNYAAYYWIIETFQDPSSSSSSSTTTSSTSSSTSMTRLANNIRWLQSTCPDTSLMGIFTENHDNPRLPSLFTSNNNNNNNTLTRIQNALTFQFLSDGIPILYQGQEQFFTGSSVPENRQALWLTGFERNTELYRHVQKLNQIRSWAIFQAPASSSSSYASSSGNDNENENESYLLSPSIPTPLTEQILSLRKGPVGKQIVCILNNLNNLPIKSSSSDDDDDDDSSTTTITLSSTASGFTPEMSLMEIFSCQIFKTDSRGNLGVTVTAGRVLVFYPRGKIEGSGVCGF
ncbi:glycoside hydrolase family 13 protein [Sphaerulina musiva SO2202]|uniref:alpha-amylase n=1 Tax=Sphaerulina musiva (strain SO2202) TaxID=692275 RepID=M3CYX1_SPHMS|nr:glycoside hydrolase family 13 protein [Sphaerulina musiva SO2202]EMF09859.1 glycoside hydrolase family 13 protein [Sphaerulina musiva SO2202]